MNLAEALRFVRRYGVVLEAARGPVPSLAEALLGVGQSGSWWTHPRAREFYGVTRAIRRHRAVLVCRLVAGKITYVHQRLWAPLYVLRARIGPGRLKAITEVHTASGKHVVRQVPFARRIPPAVVTKARQLTEGEAWSLLAGHHVID